MMCGFFLLAAAAAAAAAIGPPIHVYQQFRIEPRQNGKTITTTITEQSNNKQQ